MLPGISLFIFIFAWFLAFFVPGDILLKPLKLTVFQRLTLGTVLGLSLFSLSGYIFGYLGLRWLMYLVLLVSFVFWLKLNLFQIRLPLSKQIDTSAVLIVTAGTILNLSAVWYMSTKIDDGILFCCRGVPDAIYHLALTNQLTKNFPPFEPGSFDYVVKNYHILSDLVVADLAKIFKIDIALLHFRYMSLLMAILLGSLAFVLGGVLKLQKAFSKWLAFFLYACGDILYLLLFFRHAGLNFEVTILDDATKLLAGPPRAFSIVLFFGALCLFSIWIKKNKIYAGFLSAIIFGSLIGFKVYTGIFALAGLGCLGVYFLLKKRFLMTFPLIVALLISISVYLPMNAGAGKLQFNGLWRLENFVLHKDLKIEKLEYSRMSLVKNSNWMAILLYEVLFVVLYFTFLFGTVNLGFFQSKKSLSLFPFELNLFLISGIFVTIFLGLFFLQETGGANTIQFIIGAFIIGSIYAALAIHFWFRYLPKYLAITLGVLVILITSGRSLHEVLGNIEMILKKTDFKVSQAEMDGLLYLRNQTPSDSLVLLSEVAAENQLSLYVSYLSDRPVYLAGTGLLRDHGFDTSKKQKFLNGIRFSKNPTSLKGSLMENNVDYLFINSDAPAALDIDPNILEKVFSNEKVKIYKVS